MSEDTETREIATRNPFAAETAPQVGRDLVSVEQQRAVAEVQARYLIARRNPRDPVRAVDLILEDCMRPSLAEVALYAYTRGGTDITGPTIRLAEAIARRWGNIAAGIKEISRHGEYSECIAYAHDLETGYYDERQFQVKHWRDTKKGGYRLTDERDIYEIIANMGQRRKRAVLLSVVPGDVLEVAIEQCEKTLHAKADTSPAALAKMVETFRGVGVTKEQIEARCQRRIEALHPAQVVQLRKIFVSIRDGMSEARDWFSTIDIEGDPPKRGNAGLREMLSPEVKAQLAKESADLRARHEAEHVPPWEETLAGVVRASERIEKWRAGGRAAVERIRRTKAEIEAGVSINEARAARHHDAMPVVAPGSPAVATLEAIRDLREAEEIFADMPWKEAGPAPSQIAALNPETAPESEPGSPDMQRAHQQLRTTAEGGMEFLQRFWARLDEKTQNALRPWWPEYEAIAMKADDGEWER